MVLFSKQVKFKLLGIALGFTVAIILAELLSMIWINFGLQHTNKLAYNDLKIIDRNQQKWQPHAYLNYSPNPNYQSPPVEVGKSPSVHNSLGFRGKEFSLKKPEGKFRIVMLGGSAVYSSRVAEDDYTIPARIEISLRKKGYKNIEVINGGVSGYSTAEALINLQFKVLELSPDLIILYEAVNDLHNRYVPVELHHADNRGRLKRWEGEYFPFWAKSYFGRLVAYHLGYLNKYLFFDNYIAAPTYLGHTSSEPINPDPNFYNELLRKNTPKFYRENIVSIYGICKVRGIKLLLSTYGSTQKQHELNYLNTKDYMNGLLEMNQTVRDVSKEFNIPMVDYANEMADDAEFWRDEVHVSKHGAVISGEIFADYLIKNKLVHE